MEQSLFEQMGGTYRQVGDYLLPNFEVPQDERRIGVCEIILRTEFGSIPDIF